MTEENAFQQRRKLNETSGDAFLNDPQAQRELRFLWNGTTIEDALLSPPLEYFYPSTIGSSLFYHGSFELGEIAFGNAILAQLEEPVIIDAGANIGLHTVSWCVRQPRARSYAFEPVPANRELFDRNTARAGITDRVVLSSSALSDRVGVAEFHECSDSAYSTLREHAYMPFVASYEVATNTIDAFVEQSHLARVDFVKIDTEGFERAILTGAEATIRRDTPFLLVEIGATDGLASTEQTIRRLLDHGYRAYVINDGIVTEYDEPDDTVHNYFFAHPNRRVAIPATDPEIARNEARYRSIIIRTVRKQFIRLRADLKSKDDEILRLKSAAEERLSLIHRLTRLSETANERAGEASRSEVEELQRRVRLLEEAVSAEQRRAGSLQTQLVERAEQVRELEQRATAARSSARPEMRDAETAQLRAELGRREASLQALRSTVAALREEVSVQQQAAAERLHLIEDMERRMRDLGEQIEQRERTAAELLQIAQERDGVIARLEHGLTERETELRAARSTEERLRADGAAKNAVVDELRALVRAAHDEARSLREEIERLGARIGEVETLAQERLQVIQTINRQRRSQAVP